MPAPCCPEWHSPHVLPRKPMRISYMPTAVSYILASADLAHVIQGAWVEGIIMCLYTFRGDHHRA